MNPHTPKATPKSSRSDCKGQNPLVEKVLYNIGKLLKLECLKWLASLIYISETQVMAKRKVRNQIANLTPDH
jgi:hypothetical protein